MPMSNYLSILPVVAGSSVTGHGFKRVWRVIGNDPQDAGTPDAAFSVAPNNRCRGKTYELIGRRTTILVPCPAEVRMSNCAPRCSALVRILDNPNPSFNAA